MTPERWQEIKEIVFAAWDVEPEDRNSYLSAACADRPGLRLQVESFIASHQRLGSFIESSPILPPIHLASDVTAVLDGQRVGRYLVIEELGRGAMGIVYKAEDTVLSRKVALKFMTPHGLTAARAPERFQQEARAAATLNHPNICTIFEVGEDHGQHFIAMELVNGKVLNACIPEDGFPVSTALRYAIEISSALAHAHGHGVVHRDIKPSNLMLTGEDRVKMLDFGLAKHERGIGQDEGASLTQNGTLLGTFQYMAPEALRGEKIDARGDIWSFGVLLFELLTGRTPWDAKSGFALSAAILTEPLPPCPANVPASLRAVIDRCLRKDPKQRFADGGELEQALRAAEVAVDRRWGLPRVASGARLALLLGVALAVGIAIPGIRTYGRWRYGSSLPANRTLAVLPFENRIGGDDGRALSEGLQDSLSATLSEIERFHGSLRVIPANEVRSAGVSTYAAAKQAFNVNLVLSGSVVREGGDIHITTELANAADGARLGSKTLSISKTDPIPLHQAVAKQAADLLALSLGPEDNVVLAAGGTRLEGAYEKYLQGRGYLDYYDRGNNLDGAIDRFRGAISDDREYALGYAGLSEAYWRKYELNRDTSMLERAEEAGQRAIEIDPKIALAHASLGQIYSSTGQYDAALREFRAALEINRVCVAALRGMADVFAQTGKLAKAEQTFQEATKLRPGDWVTLTLLGRFYSFHGRYKEAVKVFAQIAKLVPASPVAMANLGAAYAAVNQMTEAEQSYKTSIAIEATARGYVGLADICFAQGRRAEAALLYQKALDLMGTSISYTTLGKLAQTFRWTPGQAARAPDLYRQAADVASKAVATNPHDAFALSWRAMFRIQTGETAQAFQDARLAMRIAPDNVRVLVNSGIVFESGGDHKKALDAIRSALERGYPSESLKAEPDLTSLQNNPAFQRMIASPENSRETP